MKAVGEREIRTRRRVVAFLREAFGYGYLGQPPASRAGTDFENDHMKIGFIGLGNVGGKLAGSATGSA